MGQQVLILALLHQSLSQCLNACYQLTTNLLFPWECILCGFAGRELHSPLCSSCRACLLSQQLKPGHLHARDVLYQLVHLSCLTKVVRNAGIGPWDLIEPWL